MGNVRGFNYGLDDQPRLENRVDLIEGCEEQEIEWGLGRQGTESLKQEEKKSFIILALDWEEMAETHHGGE